MNNFLLEINDKYHCLHSYAIKINDDLFVTKDFVWWSSCLKKLFNLNLGILHIALSVLLHTLCTYVRACVVCTLCVCTCLRALGCVALICVYVHRTCVCVRTCVYGVVSIHDYLYIYTHLHELVVHTRVCAYERVCCVARHTQWMRTYTHAHVYIH